MLYRIIPQQFLAYAPEGLTYSSEGDLAIGQGVVISVGKRKMAGFVVEKEGKIADEIKVKPVELVLSELSLPVAIIETAKSTAAHFLEPLAKIVHLFVPSSVFEGKKAAVLSYVVFLAIPEKTLGAKQKRVVEHLQLFGGEAEISHLRAETGASLDTLRTLEKQGVVRIEERASEAVPVLVNRSELQTLTEEQFAVKQQMEAEKRPSLLFGITGSGKTEIYLHLAADIVEQGKQVMILVPEIALTPQMIGHFSRVFGNESVVVIHSRISDGERAEAWWSIRSGRAKVVVGSRSALFSPFSNLGLIVIDEEHEWTYKNEHSPRYHARDVAKMMAKATGAKLVLGSATPSVESFFAAESGEYAMHTLPNRASPDSVLPEVIVCDMRDEFKKKNTSIFSDLLASELTKTLERGEQAILFLNRRGSASSVICRDCGYTSLCSDCDLPMALHRKNLYESGKLVCHHCGKISLPPNVCPQCGSANIRFVGLGTQRVEQELAKKFPKARILRVDSDTSTSKTAFDEIHRKLHAHEIDFIVGTQMIAKGLDLPKVSLVGIMLADVGLTIPDFRASERVFSLLTQVAGRAGRRASPGRVVVQTYTPEHPAIVACQTHDYEAFYRHEIDDRRVHGNPPFSHLVKLLFADPSAEKCLSELRLLEAKFKKQIAEKGLGVEVFGAPALVPKVGGRYHFHLTLKAPKNEDLRLLLSNFSPPKGWKIDVDPV